MTNNDIIKEIRKQKRRAQFCLADKERLLYNARIGQPENEDLNISVFFSIPHVDIGDAKFLPEMESQLLIRWMVPVVEPGHAGSEYIIGEPS